jgi:hypothetical protein
LAPRQPRFRKIIPFLAILSLVACRGGLGVINEDRADAGSPYAVTVLLDSVDGSRGLSDDAAVKSVAVGVENSSSVPVGYGLLAKQPDGAWRGTVSVSETGALSFAAYAYDSQSGTGTELFSGRIETVISIENRSVSIPMSATIRNLLALGVWSNDSLNAGEQKWYYFDAEQGGQDFEIMWDDSCQGSGEKTARLRVSAYKENSSGSYFVDQESGYLSPRRIAAAAGRVYLKVEGSSPTNSGTYAVKFAGAPKQGLFTPLGTALKSISTFAGLFDTDSEGRQFFYGVTRSGEYCRLYRFNVSSGLVDLVVPIRDAGGAWCVVKQDG